MTRAVCAALVTSAVLFAGCGDSAEDRAHDSGQEAGKAVRHLSDARSADDVQAGAADLRAAIGGLDSAVFDSVSAQVASRSGDIVATLRAAMDPAGFGAARPRLRAGAEEIRARAESLDNQGDSRTRAFWAGFEDGYDSG
jgi:hypothetical protein